MELSVLNTKVLFWSIYGLKSSKQNGQKRKKHDFWGKFWRFEAFIWVQFNSVHSDNYNSHSLLWLLLAGRLKIHHIKARQERKTSKRADIDVDDDDDVVRRSISNNALCTFALQSSLQNRV